MYSYLTIKSQIVFWRIEPYLKIWYLPSLIYHNVQISFCQTCLIHVGRFIWVGVYFQM